MRHWSSAILILILAKLVPAAPLEAGGFHPGTSVTAVSTTEAAGWGARIVQMVAAGELSLARVQMDADFPGRRHLRYDQRVGGVRVFGSQLAQQLDENGRTLTVFGRLFGGAGVDPVPAVTEEQALRSVATDAGRDVRVVGPVELVVLSLEKQTVLAYTMRVATGGLRIYRYFIDARTGAVAHKYDDLQTEAAVGPGLGVWSDRKKVSANSTGGTFRAEDLLRPSSIRTYDLKFDFFAADLFFRTGIIDDSLLAADPDNDWADGGVVDAHAQAGYTYDYYSRRHGRRGIDDHDLPIISITHFEAGFDNAFWNGAAMFYGDGGFFNNLAAGLDVVAHELTHGVTQFTWNGIYEGESGALNESFSDMMGTSVEFFIQPAGRGRLMADYFIGEDLSFSFAPEEFAIRSMENPGLFCHGGGFGCDPDHYNKRLTFGGPCTDGNDNCGVHINSGISNQAYYLLIEGGRNRTSGITVPGLGAANRDRAEKIFYRGFTAYLTPNARFSDARAATIRAAQELYGDDAAARTAAVWTAVGVN